MDTVKNRTYAQRLQDSCEQGRRWSGHIIAHQHVNASVEPSRHFWVCARDAGRVMPSSGAGGLLARTTTQY